MFSISSPCMGGKSHLANRESLLLCFCQQCLQVIDCHLVFIENSKVERCESARVRSLNIGPLGNKRMKYLIICPE